MDEQEHAQFHLNERLAELEAARDLLISTKRTLQLLDGQLEILGGGREAVEVDQDVSSEHRPYWLSAFDDRDHENGIAWTNTLISRGLANPVSGSILNQEDAAFVCTSILIAVKPGSSSDDPFVEGLGISPAAENNEFLVRLTDKNTGRNLISGFTVGPTDLDRGAVPLSFLWSGREGLGPFQKNKLFAEFTIPRAAAVKVELFTVADLTDLDIDGRVFFTLMGFKVYGA